MMRHGSEMYKEKRIVMPSVSRVVDQRALCHSGPSIPTEVSPTQSAMYRYVVFFALQPNLKSSMIRCMTWLEEFCQSWWLYLLLSPLWPIFSFLFCFETMIAQVFEYHRIQLQIMTYASLFVSYSALFNLSFKLHSDSNWSSSSGSALPYNPSLLLCLLCHSIFKLRDTIGWRLYQCFFRHRH